MVVVRGAKIAPGIHEGFVDLARLYKTKATRCAFESRWKLFFDATEDHSYVFTRDDDRLWFHTESFLPRTDDDRPAVLLVLGNPASQSVRAGMCFAFEGQAAREHRIWRALRETGWLEFRESSWGVGAEARNMQRRDLLLSGTYDSPFAIGIDVFFSIPSPASAPRWSGVAGLTRLFGGHAMRCIVAAEQERMRAVLHALADRAVAVIAFQRDAYEYLREGAAPSYTSVLARAGRLCSATSAGVPVRLFGAPPTRLAHTVAFRRVLRAFRETIMPSTPT